MSDIEKLTTSIASDIASYRYKNDCRPIIFSLRAVAYFLWMNLRVTLVVRDEEILN